MGLFSSTKQSMVDRAKALPGRGEPIMVPGRHTVLGTPTGEPFPEGTERAIFALGCFWGAERVFWEAGGVYTTAVGYCGGFTPNPTYEEVCTGRTGHAESVLVVFWPAKTSYGTLLVRFFEAHDPTQYMGQGNDVGTQYRSAIFTCSARQRDEATATLGRYEGALRARGLDAPMTEIAVAGPFYYAEDYHQQYLDKNPNGYCGLSGTGVSCPVGVPR